MKEKFKDVKYFSATTDIWTRSNRSFIAVSVHYFDCSLDERAEPVLKTNFIACEHFSGRHTHDRVAEKLGAIFDRFEIKEKVYFVTTDGAGEYVAAFKYFGDNYESIHLPDENDISITSASNTTATLAESNSVVDDATAHESTTAGQSMQDDKEQMMDTDFDTDSLMDVMYKGDLPKNAKEIENDSFVLHDLNGILDLVTQNCSILGKINRIDCSAHDNSDYATICTSIFGKLYEIWAPKDSRLSSEIFKQLTGKSIIGPHRIRWLKLFEAVSFNRRKKISQCRISCFIKFFLNFNFVVSAFVFFVRSPIFCL